MSTLSEIFPGIIEDCYIDEKGVYKNEEKVSVNNKSNSSYTRRTGQRTMEKIGNYVYNTTRPMRLVATSPGGDPDLFERAVINALDSCGHVITGSTTDKMVIAEEELMNQEELTKFVDVAMVMVDFNKITTELNDEDCDISLC